MALRYFLFNGVDSRGYLNFINKIERPFLPPITVPSFQIPNKAGAIPLNRNEIGVREIQISITLLGESEADFRTKVRELARFLIYEEEKELIFSDELNRKYFARFNSSGNDLEEIAELGEGTLSFTCFDPFAYSTAENTLLMGVSETIEADYTGKITGSTVENPNLFRYKVGPVLYAPVDFIAESSQASHMDKVKTIDGQYSTYSNKTAPNIPQMVWSFNVLEILERKYGTKVWNGRTSLADKVAFAATLIKKITYYWYGFGVSPLGNNIYLARYINNTDIWYGKWKFTADKVTERPIISGTAYNNIDTEGFIHLLAYTDATDGMTTSTLNTDYIKLHLEVSTLDTEIKITNNGTAPIYPILRVLPTVDCSYIKWTNVTTGKSITYNATWPAWNPLEIDTATNEVYDDNTKVNYIKNISIDSDFFSLEVGENIIRVENQNIDGTGINNQGRVYWRERYY